MSYAIETKKRKFDRILEAMNDGAAPPSGSPARSSLNSRHNTSTTSLTLDAASDSSKRRRVTPHSAPTSSISSATSDLSGHYLPSSRPAFLQRLETFRSITTWHVPSTGPINAAAWAKRGWICVDSDTVTCGVCKERVYVDLNVDNELLKSKGENEQENGGNGSADDNKSEDDFDVLAEVYDNIVKRYQGMIVTAHAQSCLWRTRGCDASIQRIEGLLNTNLALSGLRSRYDSLVTRPDEIPTVESLPPTNLGAPQELEVFRANTEDKPDINALRLAACGWERRSEDVIECRHCYRSLGLWLYRGDSPAIEKLDPVDSHLEYCPWRSADAQDSEVHLSHEKTGDGHGLKEKVPGWVLVYQAVAKNNVQRRPKPPPSVAASEPESSTGSQGSATSEQREKRMKDLLRRIKEIKKPFNVKGLLRRKEKPMT
ncbi:hypothetical protein H2200_002192 [Cladophialophora chaetospira]|uniref:Uncharacterized protein n=1 Tax=Cladophialophora chaetospira TaxID=386627 RepID=A0AA38XII3_9EURO|nr:hypothetical protein H2200_002192 [Cladophialophora chaetospira]